MVDKIHFSSNNSDWKTPPWLFELLDKDFSFDIDLFAQDYNSLCGDVYLDDAFNQDWTTDSTIGVPKGFGNPPYQRSTNSQPGTWDFVKLAYQKCYFPEVHGNIAMPVDSVLLLPARTDVAIFHECIMSKGIVHWIKGRLKFGGATDPAPFPSMVVEFRHFNRKHRMGKSISAKTKDWFLAGQEDLPSTVSQ